MNDTAETYGPRLAYAKDVGDDVASSFVSSIQGVEHEDVETAHYDARFTRHLSAGDLPDWVRLDGIRSVDAGTEAEIKTCRVTQSNGSRSTPGRYTFKGRDQGQHAYLVAEDAVYVLTVYRDGDDGRELMGAAIIKATDLDRMLADHWYDVDRREGTMSRLAWTHLIELDDGGVPA